MLRPYPNYQYLRRLFSRSQFHKLIQSQCMLQIDLGLVLDYFMEPGPDNTWASDLISLWHLLNANYVLWKPLLISQCLKFWTKICFNFNQLDCHQQQVKDIDSICGFPVKCNYWLPLIHASVPYIYCIKKGPVEHRAL